MNICVVTSLYPVEGRNDIKNDTQAIHLLLKYLAKEHNIHVFNINRISSRNLLTNFIKKEINLILGIIILLIILKRHFCDTWHIQNKDI